ncbi:MAG: hypothetical protein CMJ78_27085 [Planctomycetaceae bacterium]|nr:hypothetical protein [Planctomycetaceae bacterium]
MSVQLSLALLEVSNLSPAFWAADVCSKAAGVRLLGIESTDGADQCIKLVGSTADVRHAAEAGQRAAEKMGSQTSLAILPAPDAVTAEMADPNPVYNPALENYDYRIPKENSMSQTDALGLLETQGLVAALHATDDMLKSSNVEIVGKEKIGAAFVTIMIRGDVAAVSNAIDVGRKSVSQLGGKLIMADVIARPHDDLAKLLP